MTTATYDQHIAGSKLVSIDNGTCTIEVSSERSAEWLRGRLNSQVSDALAATIGEPVVGVRYVLAKDKLPEESPTKLKRVVIKEELVELTGDHILALILNQFLYWSERTSDVDKYLTEEKSRNPDLEVELTHGWIYKKAEELSEELMIGGSKSTMLRHIKKLVDSGYLAQRRNPRHKWDKTFQYRPNLLKIQVDLQALGYALEGYKMLEKLVSK